MIINEEFSSKFLPGEQPIGAESLTRLCKSPVSNNELNAWNECYWLVTKAKACRSSCHMAEWVVLTDVPISKQHKTKQCPWEVGKAKVIALTHFSESPRILVDQFSCLRFSGWVVSSGLLVGPDFPKILWAFIRFICFPANKLLIAKNLEYGRKRKNGVCIK